MRMTMGCMLLTLPRHWLLPCFKKKASNCIYSIILANLMMYHLISVATCGCLSFYFCTRLSALTQFRITLQQSTGEGALQCVLLTHMLDYKREIKIK